MPPAPGMMFFCYEPVCLYNAMIAPLQNYGIRGVLWYQGESNVDRRNEYAALLTALIADWRNTFGNPELPFYIVELADFLSRDDVSGRQAHCGRFCRPYRRYFVRPDTNQMGQIPPMGTLDCIAVHGVLCVGILQSRHRG